MREGGPSRRRVSGLRHQRAATAAGHKAQGGEAGGHQGAGGRLGDGGDGRPEYHIVDGCVSRIRILNKTDFKLREATARRHPEELGLGCTREGRGSRGTAHFGPIDAEIPNNLLADGVGTVEVPTDAAHARIE